MENFMKNTGDSIEEYRLNKYIAMCGICSRREADRLVEAGRVLVNGIAAQPGCLVSQSDEVIVNGQQIKLENQEKVVLAFYKPVGVTCTEKDKYAQRKITDILDYPIRVTYAGRLDKDAEGLLLMTNDGDLIDKMMRGKYGHEKEYLVEVDKAVTEDFIQGLQQGVYIKELNLTTRPCKAEAIGVNHFRIILTQGVNRQIKRMSSALGFRVKSIKRIRVLNIQLAKLKPGEYRKLDDEEMRVLYNMCDMK